MIYIIFFVNETQTQVPDRYSDHWCLLVEGEATSAHSPCACCRPDFFLWVASNDPRFFDHTRSNMKSSKLFKHNCKLKRWSSWERTWIKSNLKNWSWKTKRNRIWKNNFHGMQTKSNPMLFFEIKFIYIEQTINQVYILPYIALSFIITNNQFIGLSCVFVYFYQII